MLMIVALIVAFSAGLYVGSSNADAVKKGMAVLLATATGLAAYFEKFQGWLQ